MENAHFAYVSSIVYASCHLLSLTIHYVFESILNHTCDLTKRVFIESNDHLNIVPQINFDTNVQIFIQSKSIIFKIHIVLGLVRNVKALLFTNIAVTYPITKLKLNGFQKLISLSSEFLSKITHFIINVFGLLKRSK